VASVSAIPISDELGVNILFDDDVDRTVSADMDAGPTVLLGLVLVNADLVKNYFHIWDHVNPVIGTTAQEAYIPVANGDTRSIILPLGLHFENSFSHAASTGAGTSAAGAPGTAGDLYAISSARHDLTAYFGDKLTRRQLATEVISTTVKSSLGTERKRIEQSTNQAVTLTSSAATVRVVRINNINNPNKRTYVKFYDSTSPTVGTDDPEMLLFAPKGREVIWLFPEGISFATALSVASVDSGGTGGTTAPSNAVSVEVYY